jgi:hypothetical protein
MRLLRSLAPLLLAASCAWSADSFADLLKATNLKDADSVFALAEWCKENNEPNKAKTYYKKTVELAPDHPGARKALGQVKVGKKWLDEKAAQGKAAAGPAVPAGKGPTAAEQRWDLTVPNDPDADNPFINTYIANLWMSAADSDAMEQSIGTIAMADNCASAVPRLCANMAGTPRPQVHGPAMIVISLTRSGRRDLALRLFPFVMRDAGLAATPDDQSAVLGMIEILRDKRGVPRLIEMLGLADPDIVNHAQIVATALTGLQQPTKASLKTWWDRWHARSDLDLWKAQLSDDDARVALNAAALLIDHREGAIVPTIAKFLKTPNAAVTAQAIEVLKKMTRQDWGLSTETSLEDRVKKAATFEAWWKEKGERFEWPESDQLRQEREAQAGIQAARAPDDPLVLAVTGLAQPGVGGSQAETRLVEAGKAAVPALIGGLANDNLITRRKSADLLLRITGKQDIPFDPRAEPGVRAAAVEAWTAWAIGEKLVQPPAADGEGSETIDGQ